MSISATPAIRLTQPSEGVLYYGWVNVFLAALAMLATMPGRSHGLGLVTEPLLADLHLDRVAYAQINLWATLLGALFCLPIGVLIDRLGTRVTVSAVSLLLGVVVWYMGSVQAVVPLFVLVLLTRGFGQSALSVVSIAMVGKWFNRRLGLAMAIYSVLIGVMFSVSFKMMGKAIGALGWRQAWSTLGLIVCGLGVVFLLLTRSQPKMAEAVAEGEFDGTSTGEAANSTAASEFSFTLSEAMRTPAFWVFALATSLYGLVTSGLGLFNQAVLEERGFTAQTYYDMLVISSLAGLLTQLICGWLAQRWSIARLMCLAMLLYALGLLGLTRVSTLGELRADVVIMGASGGIITVVFFAIWRRAFGPTHLGRIQAAGQMMTVVASAVGPLLFALCHQKSGSYSPMFLLLAPVVILLGIAAWRVGERPTTPATSNV
jgi:MFS family permease